MLKFQYVLYSIPMPVYRYAKRHHNHTKCKCTGVPNASWYRSPEKDHRQKKYNVQKTTLKMRSLINGIIFPRESFLQWFSHRKSPIAQFFRSSRPVSAVDFIQVTHTLRNECFLCHCSLPEM